MRALPKKVLPAVCRSDSAGISPSSLEKHEKFASTRSWAGCKSDLHFCQRPETRDNAPFETPSTVPFPPIRTKEYMGCLKTVYGMQDPPRVCNVKSTKSSKAGVIARQPVSWSIFGSVLVRVALTGQDFVLYRRPLPLFLSLSLLHFLPLVRYRECCPHDLPGCPSPWCCIARWAPSPFQSHARCVDRVPIGSFPDGLLDRCGVP